MKFSFCLNQASGVLCGLKKADALAKLRWSEAGIVLKNRAEVVYRGVTKTISKFVERKKLPGSVQQINGLQRAPTV